MGVAPGPDWLDWGAIAQAGQTQAPDPSGLLSGMGASPQQQAPRFLSPWTPQAPQVGPLGQFNPIQVGGGQIAMPPMPAPLPMGPQGGLGLAPSPVGPASMNPVGQVPSNPGLLPQQSGLLPVSPQPASTPHGLWDRVGAGLDRLTGIPQGMGDRKMNRDAFLTNAGLALLMDSGYQTAMNRPNLSQSLGRAIQAGRQGAVGSVELQQAQQAQALATRQAQARVAALRAVRDQGNYGEAVNNLLNIGDIAGAGDVAQIADRMAGPQGKNLLKVDLGNRTVLVDPFTGQVVQEFANGSDQEGQFRDAQQLLQKYNQVTGDYRDVSLSYRTVMASSNDPSPAGDLALIFAFMKMLDARSVVREGEFANAQNTGSVPTRIWGLYNRVLTGERLTVPQRADFVRQSNNRARQTQESLNQIIQDFTGKAERAGINPADVYTDWFAGLTIPPPEQTKIPDPLAKYLP